MAYREVSVFEIKEVLRLWLRGEGYRGIDRLSGVDRKTVRRYVEAAVDAGLTPDGGEAQLTDVMIGLVCERVRPARPAGHGAGWESLVPHEEEIKAWLAKDLKLVKVQDLLARKGVVVAYRTLNRFATQRCGFGHRTTTVRVNDGEPGSELQVAPWQTTKGPVDLQRLEERSACIGIGRRLHGVSQRAARHGRIPDVYSLGRPGTPQTRLRLPEAAPS